MHLHIYTLVFQIVEHAEIDEHLEKLPKIYS